MTELDFARELIAFPSVSSESNLPVTEQLQDWLQRWRMEIERVDFEDPRGVRKANLVARLGEGPGGVAFFGHTDVVPATDWAGNSEGPFSPCVAEGRLHGRGSTDMKGPIGCMLAAIESFVGRPLRAPVYFCATADEEVGMLGAEYVARESRLYREMVAGNTRGIIGEPTGLDVYHAHKGGCGIVVTAQGRAAHSSTRHGINANWKMIPFLSEMRALYEELETDPRWRNDSFDPPTMSLNLGINDLTPALNITAPQSVCTLYFRAMPGLDADPVVERIQAAAISHGLDFKITFRATPFFVPPDLPFVQECLDWSSHPVPRTASYGTDAGRFQELKNRIVMGPGSIALAHTNDEWVALDDLQRGTAVYRSMIERWCL